MDFLFFFLDKDRENDKEKKAVVSSFLHAFSSVEECLHLLSRRGKHCVPTVKKQVRDAIHL